MRLFASFVFYVSVLSVLVAMPLILCGSSMIAITPVESVWLQQGYAATKFNGPWNMCDIPGHLTQLLYGERIEVVSKNGSEWIRVKLLDQLKFEKDSGMLEAHEGWIKKRSGQYVETFLPRNMVVTSLHANVYETASETSKKILQLSMGSLCFGEPQENEWIQTLLYNGQKGFVQTSNIKLLDAIDIQNEALLRATLVERFTLFLGSPYCWGGRSVYDPTASMHVSSVDCSGLINLVYMTCGFMIPRFSRHQFHKAQLIPPSALKPGDLIFTKTKSADYMSHVMMYLGDGMIGESFGRVSIPPEERVVRAIKDTDRFGVSLKNIHNGYSVDDNEIYAASFLSDPLLRAECRALVLQ